VLPTAIKIQAKLILVTKPYMSSEYNTIFLDFLFFLHDTKQAKLRFTNTIENILCCGEHVTKLKTKYRLCICGKIDYLRADRLSYAIN
jgi:hypothetical protein